MEIKRFRIFNYKSIIDSGDCYISPTVTILAGKNEAGKSSILEALEDFNIGEIRKDAHPISNKSAIPRIEIYFSVPKKDLESIFEEFEFESKTKIPDTAEFRVIKTASQEYEIIGDFLDKSGLLMSPNYQEELTPLISEINTTLSAFTPPFVPLSLASKATPIKLLEEVHDRQSRLRQLKDVKGESPNGELRALNTIEEVLNNNIKYPYVTETDFVSTFLEYIPNFILFNSFEDVFPNKVPLAELKSNPWIRDLEKISDIDVSTILSSDDREKRTHKKHLNIQLNDEMKQFWSNDYSHLEIDWDSENLHFWIEENGQAYEPSLRSQGKKWHLAFYIKVSARSKEDLRNVILIDEPGLYLHASVQKDILRKLDDAAEGAPVIFSTHSPYLIEPDKLDRVRLVLKEKGRGTYIENKIHSVSDKETLTPILTAIGAGINHGIVNVNHARNVVVEGPSDYFYLNAFAKIFPKATKPQINFIHGGSSGNMPKVGTILQGWSCKVVYLYDTDQAYKDSLNNIKKDWETINKDMLCSLPIEGAIEDMLSKQDFAKYVLCDPSYMSDNMNSTHAKRKDKVLLAKLFFELTSKVNSENAIKLSDETLANIQSLWEVLNNKFGGCK